MVRGKKTEKDERGGQRRVRGRRIEKGEREEDREGSERGG
jgi:hypothetical protein